MKILFVLEYYYPNIGGVETLFKTLAESLVQQGNEVKVVSIRFKKELKKTEMVNGVEVNRISLNNRFSYALLSGFFVFKAAKGFDLIHTTSSSAGFPAVIAAKLRRKKVIVTFHELWGKLWFNLPFMNWPTRTINYVAEQVIAHLPYNYLVAVSDSTRQSLIGAGILPEKIIRIYNGLEYEDFEGYRYEPPAEFTFTFFGRLGVSKGLDLLLPASMLFFKKHKNTRLKLIIPRIPMGMFRKINQLIKHYGIAENIELFHNLSREQLYNEICSSHCVVIPSYSEGFGFSATESVGLSVPVISSGQKSLKEVVSGKFIEMEKQDATSLLNALEQAYAGEWNYSPMKKFELIEQVKAYEELYQRLL